MKLRNKNNSFQVNKFIENYTVWDDYLWDMKLLPYDLKWSEAHVKMLKKIWILNADEEGKLLLGLIKIKKLYDKWEFKIVLEQEDCHTAIELFLTDLYPELWKKIHTWRSRNDQILVTLRLYMNGQLGEILKQLDGLIQTFGKKIKMNESVLMPGYTHMQKAMPSSVGMWLWSFEAVLKDDKTLLQSVEKILDQNPLGSVAGFWESVFGLDKEFTTKLLGFQKIQENPMYCAYSRGKFELILLQWLWQIMLDLGKFANDLLLFSMQEFGYFDLPDSFKTGSSVMPQKKNWDVMELVRGNLSVFQWYEFQVKWIISNLPSGYNRDFQLSKKPLLEAISLVQKTIWICDLVVEKLIVNKQKLKDACSKDLYATQEVYDLVKKWMSFRKAYKKIANKF